MYGPYLSPSHALMHYRLPIEVSKTKKKKDWRTRNERPRWEMSTWFIMQLKYAMPEKIWVIGKSEQSKTRKSGTNQFVLGDSYNTSFLFFSSIHLYPQWLTQNTNIYIYILVWMCIMRNTHSISLRHKYLSYWSTSQFIYDMCFISWNNIHAIIHT